MTAAEVRDAFLSALKTNSDYWLGRDDLSVQDKLLGAHRSILSLLVGNNELFPRSILTALPYGGDRDFRPLDNSNWYPSPDIPESNIDLAKDSAFSTGLVAAWDTLVSE